MRPRTQKQPRVKKELCRVLDDVDVDVLSIKQKTLKSAEQSITSIANNVTKILWAKLLGY